MVVNPVEKKVKKSVWRTLREIFFNKNVVITISITLILLLLFHIGSSITVPVISLPSNFAQDDSFTSMLNLLAGGGLSKMSLFAVGVGPYITAQIIVQLLSTDLIPPMSRMAKAGERGRRKLEVITRFLTLPFAIAQGYAIIALLLNSTGGSASQISIFGKSAIGDLSAGEIISLLVIFTGGTYICIFFGDMITKRGVGNGVTLIILAGIVASFVPNFREAITIIKGKFTPTEPDYLTNVVLSCTLYVLFFFVILIVVVFINGSTRKIPIQQTGQGLTTEINNLPYLPIKLNSAGVIPVIFASSLLTIPGTIAQFLPDTAYASKSFITSYLSLNSWWGLAIYFVLIILFTFFYSYVQINPHQLTENFEKSGKFIPGVKNGEATEKHITKVLNRVNWIGGPFLAIIAVLPYILSKAIGVPSGLSLGGTGMIIVVTGAVELWNSIKSSATTSGYNLTRTRIVGTNQPTIVKEEKQEQLW
ncbi:MAG: preprotein translocase subunit SecY [Mycoplasmataceae bacterium]|nr:preprotein translocase subunit SecY [Mycoplasmataceae bacterium]